MSAEKHVSTERIQSEFEEWNLSPEYTGEESAVMSEHRRYPQLGLEAIAFLAGWRANEKRMEEES